MITITKQDMEQKIKTIYKNMQIIKEGIDADTPPIFVELIGTPKSGKTTLLKKFLSLFQNNGIEIFTRRETAEYNPVEKKSEQYDLWMVLELFKNLSEDISNKQGKIVIYDRGILDRLIWLEKGAEEGEIRKRDLDIIKGLYNLESIKKEYRPITLGFLTSPELSIKRKGSVGRYVNEETLKAYNRILLEKQREISEISESRMLIKTDSYQGKLEEFILDMSLKLTEQIARTIRIKKEKEKEKEKDIGEEI